MSMEFQRIAPLWEALPSREAQPAAKGRAAEGSVFADVFQSLVDNVREAEDGVAKTEYLLSTGQLDNPAEMSLASANAELAMSLLVELRERAINVYSELTRISL